MINKIKYPVKYRGIEYEKIVQFDCETLHFKYSKSGVFEFYDVLDISSLKVRETSETLAEVIFSKNETWSKFKILDDKGIPHVVELHNSLHQEIFKARRNARIINLIKQRSL